MLAELFVNYFQLLKLHFLMLPRQKITKMCLIAYSYSHILKKEICDVEYGIPVCVLLC